MELNSKGLTFKFFTAARLELKENRRFLDKPLISLRQKSWFHLALKDRKPETLYRIKCDVGANKNAGQAFSMPRLSSHFLLYQIFAFLFFGFRWKLVFKSWMEIRVLSSGKIFSSGDFYSSENHRLLDNPLFFPQTKILIPY